MRATTLVCALVATITPCARSDLVNVIVQYNAYYNDPNSPGYPFYEIVPPPANHVRIYHAVADKTFEFEAGHYDPNDGSYVEEGDIGAMIADPDAGPVTLTILGHNGHAYGARNVGQIDLSAPGVTGTIGDANIRDSLGALGETVAHAASGSLVIGGEPEFASGDVLSDVHLDTLGGSVYCGGLRSLYIAGDSGQGAMIVNKSWGDPNDANNSGDPNDTIHVGGSLSYLYFRHNCGGRVQIDGDLTELDLEGIGEYGQGNLTPTGSIQVVGALGEIRDATNIDGVVDVGSMGRGNINAGLSGTVHIRSATTDTFHFEVEGQTAGQTQGQWTGALIIDGDFRGEILYVSRGKDASSTPLSGLISIGYGDPNAPGNCYGNISVGDTYFLSFVRDLTGSIEIAGNLYGDIDITGYFGDLNSPETPFAGHIRIDGAFAADPNDPNAPTDPNDPNAPRIHIGQRVVGQTSYVAVDYDGYHSEHEWRSPATVVVDHPDPNDPNAAAAVYAGNTPALRLWRTSSCRGDMNNDTVTNFKDINPFVLALSDPSAYALAFPGLSGSMVYHGDINEDGSFNLHDINPLVVLLTSGGCHPEDLGQRGDTRQARSIATELSAEELAAVLAENVEPALYDGLVAVIAQGAAEEAEDESGAYWEAVYEALVR